MNQTQRRVLPLAVVLQSYAGGDALREFLFTHDTFVTRELARVLPFFAMQVFSIIDGGTQHKNQGVHELIIYEYPETQDTRVCISVRSQQNTDEYFRKQGILRSSFNTHFPLLIPYVLIVFH